MTIEEFANPQCGRKATGKRLRPEAATGYITPKHSVSTAVI
jgi:hypothetical protein